VGHTLSDIPRSPLLAAFCSTPDRFRCVNQHVAVQRTDETVIALLGPSTGPGAMTALATAQLFASAPDMLYALERLGCQDEGNCGPELPDGRCFRCRVIDQVGGQL